MFFNLLRSHARLVSHGNVKKIQNMTEAATQRAPPSLKDDQVWKVWRQSRAGQKQIKMQDVKLEVKQNGNTTNYNSFY